MIGITTGPLQEFHSTTFRRVVSHRWGNQGGDVTDYYVERTKNRVIVRHGGKNELDLPTPVMQEIVKAIQSLMEEEIE